MSGLASLIHSALDENSDEVSIQVQGTNLRGWESVSITRSCESIPNAFQVTASPEFLSGPGRALTQPGQPCKVLIGNDLVITGWIDRRTISTTAESHEITITGRGITRNLVDCSADLNRTPGLTQGQIRSPNVLELARLLASTWPNIKVESPQADLGISIPSLQVSLGETPYQIIESVCRYAGFLCFEDERGRLILDRVGKETMASGFRMPGNIENIHAERSVDGRYSHYFVVYNPVGKYLQEGGPKSNQRAEVVDEEMFKTEYRPKIIVWPGATPLDVGPDENVTAKRMAEWEWMRRRGRGQAASITMDSWRAMSLTPGQPGELWQPNRLATIHAPEADIDTALWIIGTVTYRKDLSGTHSDIVLMPPSAFAVNPNPLNLFDRQITTAAQGNVAPPSTGAPGQSPFLPPGATT